MPTEPKISVIVPAYNAEDYLAETVRSVRSQARTDWELVVVDDGSTDGTGALADRLAAEDGRVRAVHQNNAGLSGARNAGLAASSDLSGFVLFLDADDVLEPDALGTLAGLLDARPQAPAAHGLARYIDAEGRTTLPGAAEAFGRARAGVRGGRLAARPLTDATDLSMLLYRNPILTPGLVLIRRSALSAAGPFDTALPPTADWDMWLRLARQGAMPLADSVTLGYRRHGQNMSGRDEVMRPAEITLRAKAFRDGSLPPGSRRDALDGFRLSERGHAALWLDLARARLGRGHVVFAAKLLRRALLFYVRSLSGSPLTGPAFKKD